MGFTLSSRTDDDDDDVDAVDVKDWCLNGRRQSLEYRAFVTS